MREHTWKAAGRCIVAMLLVLSFASSASAESAGTANVFEMAGGSYLPYLNDPSLQEQQWFNTHIWRMGVYAPYFNERTSWYHNGWVYKDSYAIYPGSALASEHPEWILKDASGHDLYIPWGCSNDSCPQYAGDIASASYRRAWIEGLRAEVAAGYRGAFIDDVNMSLDVSNGEEELVAPIDPSTGQPMTAEAWRGFMARFMQEVRAALPNIEITHNAVWFADEDAGTANANIRAEIESANYIFLQRGANDPGLTGGDGRFSLNAMLSYIDQVHALGKNVVLEGTAEDPQGLNYNLASYFLVSSGNDGVSGGGQTPANWWSGWSTELGEAQGGRYEWQGLLRRDFADGTVLVNPPGEKTETVALPEPMQDAEGAIVTSVSLPADSAVILKGDTPALTESPGSPAPAPTQTIVTTVSTPPASGGAQALETPASGGPAAGALAATLPASPTTASPAPASKAPAAQESRSRRTERARQRQRAAPRARRAVHKMVLTRIAGRVLHATAGTTTINVELRLGRRWIRVAHVTVPLSGAGRFLDRLLLIAGKRYRVRARYSGTFEFRPSSSRYRVLLPSVA
jgi:hypothetical protein